MKTGRLRPSLLLSSSMIDLDEHRFQCDIEDLLALPELASSRDRVHHYDLTEFDHLLSVARNAHRLSRLVKADARICARAGLLHDLGAHWFNTVAPCALAERLDEPHAVRHAIRSHTVVPHLPRSREAWIVVAADFLATAQETQFVLRRSRLRAGQALRENITRRRAVIVGLAALRSRPPAVAVN